VEPIAVVFAAAMLALAFEAGLWLGRLHSAEAIEKARKGREEGETVLTEDNRKRLVEELASIIQSSLPLMLKAAAEDHKREPQGAGSLDDWYASRSTIPTTRVHGRSIKRDT
jgi:hypothetical protein